MPGVDTVDYLTNTSILELDTVPRHLVVVGGSYIGLEFAQMYRRFGAEVTVVEKGAAADRPRGRGCLGGHPRASLQPKASRSAPTPTCIGFTPHADGVAVGVDCTHGRSDRRRLACAARRRTPAQHRRSRSRQGRRRDRCARLHRRRRRAARPTCPASGRSAIATAAAPSRTRPTTISRSSPPTCSTATAAASATASRLCALHRSAARPGRHDRGGGARKTGRTLLVVQAADDARRARDREGRDARAS